MSIESSHLVVETLPSPYSFPPSRRILQAAEYGKVFKKGRRVRMHGVLLIYLPNGTKIARLGMAIAKKHVKRAVGRNRIKRHCREIFRYQQHAVAGHDIVIMLYHKPETENIAVVIASLFSKIAVQ